MSLPVQAVHIDLCRASAQLDDVLANFPKDKVLSLGLVDGRNIWRTDLHRAISMGRKAVENSGGDRVWVAPSCSLLHSPIDLDHETRMDFCSLKAGWPMVSRSWSKLR